MRNKLLTIAIVALCLLMPLSADNITSFGMNGGYDSFTEKPEMGMYMTSLFIDARHTQPISIGFGTRIEMNAPIPTDSMSACFLSGLAVDFKFKRNWGMDILVGPEFGITTMFGETRSDGMYIGGGADISATYYLNSNRSSGINIGVSGSYGVYSPDSDTAPAVPCGNVHGYVGFTFRSGFPGIPRYVEDANIYLSI